MVDLPEIGSQAHFVEPDGSCVSLFVHSHMTATHLELADVPPSSDPAAPQRTRTVFAVPSDGREPGTWHTDCQ
jgi:hypothetical protein